MHYGDYIANVTRMAVELVNTGSARGVSPEMFDEHEIVPPSEAELAPLLPLLRAVLDAITSGGGIDPVNRLLTTYPPHLHVSAHDGIAHLHHAREGSEGLQWIGRTCAAGLAHVACGAPDVSARPCRWSRSC